MAKNFLYGAIALSSLVLPGAFMSAVEALPREPDYFCYEWTATEGLTNLNSMCAQNPAVTIQRPSTPTSTSLSPNNIVRPTSADAAEMKPVEVQPEARRVFDFSELSYENGRLVGSVKNKTGKPMGRAFVLYKVYKRKDASNWQLVDTGRARVLDEGLKAGQSSAFEASIIGVGDKVVITNVNQ